METIVSYDEHLGDSFSHDHFLDRWFDLYEDPDTKTSYHKFNGKYWDCKLRGDWSKCPDLYS